MKRWLQLCCMLFLMLLLFTGCDNGSKEEAKLEEGSYKVYYINAYQTGIAWEKYTAKSNKTNSLIQELLEQLVKDPTQLGNKYTISSDVVVKDFDLSNDGLIVNFDSTYINQKPIEEALMRACIVKTLTQIQEVDYVEFYVNGTPLTDAYGKAIDQMTAEDFIDDNDVETSYTPASLTLYFANEDGDKLLECVEKRLYDGTITMEQLIIRRLIEGPDREEKRLGMREVVPANTVLNNVTTKEGVCYVDFNKNFLDVVEGVTEEVTIYSVVNSLVELSNINKVQIMIDGKIVSKFRDSMELDIIYERKLGLVEGTK